MIYSQQDYLLLETMSDSALESEIQTAREEYDNVVEYFHQLEEEARAVCAFESCQPNLDILFSQLKNIEGYIRKAENLLNDYDDGAYINRARRNRERNIKDFYKKLNTQKAVSPIKLLVRN